MASQTVSAVPTSSACVNLYNTPVNDAVCAMPYASNHTQIMSACCKNAAVVSYYSDCGLYCLAVDQSVADLTKCLYENGAAWGDVFCKGNVTATATATGGGDISASASARTVTTGGAITTGKTTARQSGTSTPTSSTAAAPLVRPQTQMNLFGVLIGTLLLSSTVVGALQTCS